MYWPHHIPSPRTFRICTDDSACSTLEYSTLLYITLGSLCHINKFCVQVRLWNGAANEWPFRATAARPYCSWPMLRLRRISLIPGVKPLLLLPSRFYHRFHLKLVCVTWILVQCSGFYVQLYSRVDRFVVKFHPIPWCLASAISHCLETLQFFLVDFLLNLWILVLEGFACSICSVVEHQHFLCSQTERTIRIGYIVFR